MPIKSKKLFYAEKILRVLGPEWKNVVTLLDEANSQIVHPNAFYREFKDGMFTEICFDIPAGYNKLNSIRVSAYRYGRRFFPGDVNFDLVTDVKYMYRSRILVVASRDKNFFSKLLVFSSGNFRTFVGVPISEFRDLSLDFQRADEEEEWYTTLD